MVINGHTTHRRMQMHVTFGRSSPARLDKSGQQVGQDVVVSLGKAHHDPLR